MTGCGPPSSVNSTSPLPRVAHNGFGSQMSDLGIFMPSASFPTHSRFHYAYACHSDALPGSCFKKKGMTLFHASRLMLPHLRFPALHSFHAISSCNHLVSDLFSPTRVGSFQLSLALLVRYRSLANI